MSNAARPSKNDRRDLAREKAREQRVRQQKKEKRSRLILQASIGLVVLAIVAIVAVVIVNSVKPAGPGPRNMASGGLTVTGASESVVATGAAAGDATPAPQSPAAGQVLIQVYEDFGCPVCQAFEQANGTQLANLVKSGAAQVQYHPVAILDRNFTDGDYSTRAANAAAVVANSSPAAFLKFHASLYETDVQPAEGSSGLDDDRLVALAKAAGATSMTQVEKGIRDQQFVAWVGARTEEFQDSTGPLADVEFPADRQGAGTPTVIVNGQYYTGDPRSADAFGAFVTSVGGAASSSPVPTPSPSPSPSATD